MLKVCPVFQQNYNLLNIHISEFKWCMMYCSIFNKTKREMNSWNSFFRNSCLGFCSWSCSCFWSRRSCSRSWWTRIWHDESTNFSGIDSKIGSRLAWQSWLQISKDWERFPRHLSHVKFVLSFILKEGFFCQKLNEFWFEI